MRRKTPSSEQPPMRAPSSRLSGMPWQKLRKMTQLKALIATGRISDHSESMRPSAFTTMNVGIMPPENSIVNTTRKLMTRRPLRCFFDSAYAMNAVSTRLTNVPTTVTNTETPMARKIVGVDRRYGQNGGGPGLTNVPATVTNTEAPKARKVGGGDRKFRFGLSVNVSGQRMKGRVASSPGVASELASTLTNGSTHTSAKAVST